MCLFYTISFLVSSFKYTSNTLISILFSQFNNVVICKIESIIFTYYHSPSTPRCELLDSYRIIASNIMYLTCLLLKANSLHTCSNYNDKILQVNYIIGVLTTLPVIVVNYLLTDKNVFTIPIPARASYRYYTIEML